MTKEELAELMGLDISQISDETLKEFNGNRDVGDDSNE